MGGALILVGALVPTLIYPRPSGDLRLLLGVVLATVAFGLIGFLDDYLIIRRGKNLGLRAREKLAGQIVVALAFAGWYWWSDPSGRFFDHPLLEPGRVLLALYHILLMVGMSNAVNLTDGLDGLAAGVSLPVWVAMALMAGLGGTASVWLGGGIGDHGLVIFCAAFAGATLGYLWYNAHPAQVFMGDTGSLAIGGGMAAAAIALHLEWILLVLALVHLVEAASVTLQVISFKTTGKRIFKMSPLHHHFELCEQPETRIVARFAIASAVCAALGLALFFRA
jgi:phospho-N-acetylmuramoyl-pentapeptide-transferase